MIDVYAILSFCCNTMRLIRIDGPFIKGGGGGGGDQLGRALWIIAISYRSHECTYVDIHFCTISILEV